MSDRKSPPEVVDEQWLADLYREGDHEHPSAPLDQAILELAQAQTQGQRWQKNPNFAPGLATAAVILLSVGVVLSADRNFESLLPEVELFSAPAPALMETAARQSVVSESATDETAPSQTVAMEITATAAEMTAVEMTDVETTVAQTDSAEAGAVEMTGAEMASADRVMRSPAKTNPQTLRSLDAPQLKLQRAAADETAAPAPASRNKLREQHYANNAINKVQNGIALSYQLSSTRCGSQACIMVSHPQCSDGHMLASTVEKVRTGAHGVDFLQDRKPVRLNCANGDWVVVTKTRAEQQSD
ncbi:MAG: hypothetical protein AAF529_22975 [Pseudomonadota bacterium]